MKTRWLLVSLLFVMQSAFAYQYDVIITKSRMQIQCTILSQDEGTITYKLDNDSEPIVIRKSDIEKIYPRSDEASLPKVKEEPVIDKKQSEPAIDIIVLKDATRIEAIVIEIGDNEIKYHEIGKDSPVYTKHTADISTILLANGDTKVFNALPVVPEQKNIVETSSPAPSYTPKERPQQNDVEWVGGGRHTDKHGNTRTDFPGGHKTVYADGSEQISVPFVTINKKGGGRGVDMPATDDIKGFQLIDYYGDPEDNVIIINKSSQPDCFKVAVCSVKNNQYFWKIVLNTKELVPYRDEIKKQKDLYRAITEDELNEVMNNKDRFIYSVAIKSRYGYDYSFKTYKDGDDLIIEVLDPDSNDSDW